MAWFFKSSMEREVDGLKRVPLLAQKRDVPGLIRMLGSEFSSVRDAAIKALGQAGDSSAVGPLLALFSKSEDWGERSSIAKALGGIADSKAVEPLIAALKNDSDDTVRFNAALALGFIGDTRATKDLLEILKQESDSTGRVHHAAGDALRRIKDPKAFDALCEMLTEDEITSSNFYQRVAVKLLGDIGDARAIPVLVRILVGADNIIAMDAAESLGKLGGDAAVDALMAALVRRGEYAAAAAAKSLGKIGDPRAVDALTHAQDRGGIVQRDAEAALKAINSRLVCAEESAQH